MALGPSQDADWMARAIRLARQAPRLPFAAVVVSPSGDVLGEALNETDARGPLWHAEVAAIDRVARAAAPSWEALTLYTTAEPCPMCMGAILFAGVRRVVFGTSIETLAALGWWQVRLPAAALNHAAGSPVTIVGGVCADETDVLFAVR